MFGTRFRCVRCEFPRSVTEVLTTHIQVTCWYADRLIASLVRRGAHSMLSEPTMLQHVISAHKSCPDRRCAQLVLGFCYLVLREPTYPQTRYSGVNSMYHCSGNAISTKARSSPSFHVLFPRRSTHTWPHFYHTCICANGLRRTSGEDHVETVRRTLERDSETLPAYGLDQQLGDFQHQLSAHFQRCSINRESVKLAKTPTEWSSARESEDQ